MLNTWELNWKPKQRTDVKFQLDRQDVLQVYKCVCLRTFLWINYEYLNSNKSFSEESNQQEYHLKHLNFELSNAMSLWQ